MDKAPRRRQLPETPSGSSLEKTNKIIPDLVIRASHLSGSNGVDVQPSCPLAIRSYLCSVSKLAKELFALSSKLAKDDTCPRRE